MKNRSLPLMLFFIALTSMQLSGQGNYEIQVYPSETVGKGNTMVEIHSNITALGPKINSGTGSKTTYPFHETLEITHGFWEFFEVGLYQFTNLQKGLDLRWVGTHLRPRISAPEAWHWPIGLSFSTEIGYQSQVYSPNPWTLEIRPVIDRDFKLLYISFNPAFGKSLQGTNKHHPPDFEPGMKIAFHLNPKIDFGGEYYGSTGPLFHPRPAQDQQHTLFAALDLNMHPNWEFNLGAGWGLTDSTDRFMIKFILGYKFVKKKRPDA